MMISTLVSSGLIIIAILVFMNVFHDNREHYQVLTLISNLFVHWVSKHCFRSQPLMSIDCDVTAGAMSKVPPSFQKWVTKLTLGTFVHSANMEKMNFLNCRQLSIGHVEHENVDNDL